MPKEKKTGYEGEQVIAFPQIILSKCSKMPLIKYLYINRMGMFPRAVNHYYSRDADKAQYAVLLHCHDGEGWIIVRGKKIILNAGQAFIIPPHVSHSYGASEKNPWSIFWMHISGINVPELINVINVTTKNTAIITRYSEERTNLFNQIFKTLSNGFTDSNLVYANLALANYLGTFIAVDSFDNLASKPASEPDEINDAIAFMQTNIGETLSVEEMAKHVSMSSSFFFKKFKTVTGYSPVAYFNFLKIQKAIQLIHTRKLNINQVASKIGIDDPFYFSRLFKKQMGISPRRYINEFVSHDENSQQE
jgi:AraC-like DNA-binding protein